MILTSTWHLEFYKLKIKNGTKEIFPQLTMYIPCVQITGFYGMIDPATGWFEVKELKDKETTTVTNIVEQTWLTCYPWHSELIFDRGTEFMGEFAKMIEEDYGITCRGATTRNPQANSVLERIHQILGKIIRTFEFHDSDLTDCHGSLWDGILSAAMFALRATYHTTLQATPCQLVFGRDAMLNVEFEANWQLIKQCKLTRIHENNVREMIREFHINTR